jgi:hypothetical protein
MVSRLWVSNSVLRAGARRGRRSLAARVAGADDDNVEVLRMLHGHTFHQHTGATRARLQSGGAV